MAKNWIIPIKNMHIEKSELKTLVPLPVEG